jgi:hypothetical protein
MFAQIQRWLFEIGGKIEVMLNFRKGTLFRLSGLLRVNCKAKLRVTCYLVRRIQNLRAKIIVLRLRSGSAQALLRLCSGSTPAYLPSAQACSGLLRLAQACSGSAPACSPTAQVKAAVAHVRRLKRNQRKGKLIQSVWGFETSCRAIRRKA